MKEQGKAKRWQRDMHGTQPPAEQELKNYARTAMAPVIHHLTYEGESDVEFISQFKAI